MLRLIRAFMSLSQYQHLGLTTPTPSHIKNTAAGKVAALFSILQPSGCISWL